MTSEVTPELFSTMPDAAGRFGRFGGKFVAETLMSALADLEKLYADLKDDPAFQREFDLDLAHYVGRPSPLYEAARLSDAIGGGRIFLKREDLNHTGAHKVITPLVRHCWPSIWEKSVSSPRQERGNMGSPVRPWRRG